MYSDLPLVSTSHLDARKQVPTASGTGILVVGAVPCYNLKVSSPRTVSAVVRRRPADSPALSPSDFSKAGPCAAFFLQTTYLLKKAGLVWAFFLVISSAECPLSRLAFPLLLERAKMQGAARCDLVYILGQWLFANDYVMSQTQLLSRRHWRHHAGSARHKSRPERD